MGPPAAGFSQEHGTTRFAIGAAMAQFTQALGIQWGPIQGATFNVRLENGQVKAIRLDAVLSVQGPPYVELIRVQLARGREYPPFPAPPPPPSPHPLPPTIN